MGNYRFRLSDVIPNAWFYKLKDMSRGRKQRISHSFRKKTSSSTTTISQKSNISQPRYTYYFTAEQPNRADTFYNSPINRKASDTHFPDSPRRSSSFSSKKRSKRKTIYKPSPKLVSSSFSFWSSANSIDQSHSSDHYYSSSPLESSPESLLSETEESDFGFLPNDSFDKKVGSCSSSNCNCILGSSNSADIIIDVNGESFISKTKEINGFDSISEAELPPILAKPRKFKRSPKLEEIKANESLFVKIVKEERISTQKEKRSPSSMGIRLRTNSPRIASKKIQACARKSLSRNKILSESLAVVKSSVDPQKDFKDSMVEMIIENNIRASKDLEDLLACYLTLNSEEYHDLIVKAFEQIWLDMTDLRL